MKQDGGIAPGSISILACALHPRSRGTMRRASWTALSRASGQRRALPHTRPWWAPRRAAAAAIFLVVAHVRLAALLRCARRLRRR